MNIAHRELFNMWNKQLFIALNSFNYWLGGDGNLKFAERKVSLGKEQKAIAGKS